MTRTKPFWVSGHDAQPGAMLAVWTTGGPASGPRGRCQASAAGERPYLVLTRTAVIPLLERITVAPCSTRIRDIPTELPLGQECGLHHASVAQLDSIMPALKSSLHGHLGTIGPDGHAELCRRLGLAFGSDM